MKGKSRVREKRIFDFPPSAWPAVFLLFAVAVSGRASGIVFDGRSVFGLTDSTILQYDRTTGSFVRQIGFYGKPIGVDSGNGLYLVTSRGLFQANPATGQFTDIFPLYEFPEAMFLYKNSLDLLTRNELMVFDCAQKFRMKLSVFLEPAERIPAFSPGEGRLFLAKQKGGLEIFEEGKRQLRFLPFPAAAVKIVAAGAVIYGAAKQEVFAYDWKKGKVQKRLAVSEPVTDIAFAGNFLAASTDGQLLVIDTKKWQVVGKYTGGKLAAGGWKNLVIENDRLFACQGSRVEVFTLPGLAPVRAEEFQEPILELRLDPLTKTVVGRGETKLYFGTGRVIEPAAAVNEPVVNAVEPAESLFAIQVGAFGSKANAENFGKELLTKGFAYAIVGDSALFKVRVGYFSLKEDAQAASAGLKEYKPWIVRDRVGETIKPATGVDLNRDGNRELVTNLDGRVVIFSFVKNIYRKIWESPAEPKLTVTGIGADGVGVEAAPGKKGTIKWAGERWELRF